jgi:hypothetical protein
MLYYAAVYMCVFHFSFFFLLFLYHYHVHGSHPRLNCVAVVALTDPFADHRVRERWLSVFTNASLVISIGNCMQFIIIIFSVFTVFSEQLAAACSFCARHLSAVFHLALYYWDSVVTG